MSLMAAKKKLLMAQGGGGLDVSEVFNISLWLGNSAPRTITTDIDSDEGALAWLKCRMGFGSRLFDTDRGATKYLDTSSAGASVTSATSLTAFTSTGYNIGSMDDINYGAAGGFTNVGWQFREAPGFFRTALIAHTTGAADNIDLSELGAVGFATIKRTDSTSDWFTWHRSLSPGNNLRLNTDAGQSTSSAYVSVSGTTLTFSASAPTGTYVLHAWAHDAAADGVIQCGTFDGNGSASGPLINLGWRPQYLMIKGNASSRDWVIIDTARGTGVYQIANAQSADISATLVTLTTAGFQVTTSSSVVNISGVSYLYVAIREAA